MTTSACQRVLILGADGFIGRHIAFYLRDAGFHVIASARRTVALAQMGFEVLKADLTRPETHSPEFWRPHLSENTWLVNAAGLLTGTEQAFEAVHARAPAAVYDALSPKARAVLISAVGIEADTPFGRWRRQGETAAQDSGSCISILRPGLVMGDTSYGGTSVERSLAAMPWITPVIGDGQQQFNPIHATDLAAEVAWFLQSPATGRPQDIGGPEKITFAALLSLRRRWYGLAPARVLRLPLGVARLIGRFGDLLRMGPISSAAVAQLEHGVLADTSASRPGRNHKGVRAFVFNRPAGTQDLWHARLYLLRPLLRLTLVFLWAASGLLGLFLPTNQFLPLLGETGLPDLFWTACARIMGLIDLALAFALIRNLKPRFLGLAQLAIVAGYTAGFTFLAAALWMLPLGGLLKNLPVLMLILVWMILEEER